MDGRMLASLDNWITGHYGEDQFRGEPIEIEDEGLAILRSAEKYLAAQEQAAENQGNEDQAGDLNEVVELVADLARRIENEYSCRYCGKPLPDKSRYCSRNCARADELY